jgi:hypothetical protein
MNSYGVVVEYEQSRKLEFPDFEITYDGTLDPEEELEIKTTASLRYRFFEVRSGEEAVILKIVHGQLPPPNKDFVFLGKKYRLYPFKGPGGEHLKERHFVIEKLS